MPRPTWESALSTCASAWFSPAKAARFAKMLPLFRLGLGGNLGSGRQWMSWIALPTLR